MTSLASFGRGIRRPDPDVRVRGRRSLMQPLRVVGDDACRHLHAVSRAMLVQVAGELQTAHRAGYAGIAYHWTVPSRPDGHHGVWAPSPRLARRRLRHPELDELQVTERRAHRRRQLQEAFAAVPPQPATDDLAPYLIAVLADSLHIGIPAH